MKKFLLGLTALLVATMLRAQDLPVKCENAITPFDDVMKVKLTSQVRTAHYYYVNSTDPSAGGNYDQRMANLQKEINRTFQAFMSARRAEYRKAICYYHKIDWNQPGNRSSRTLTVQPGFYLITTSLKRTTNGDWKAGPEWKPNNEFPTSITWETGGHRRSETFVDITAKYSEEFIKNIIIKELNLARKELNDLGIPTEVPPFLD
jgi:hypothetical protein